VLVGVTLTFLQDYLCIWKLEPVEEERGLRKKGNPQKLKKKMNSTNFSLSSNYLFLFCVTAFGSIQQLRIA